MEAWIENLKVLQALHADIIVPSHGSIEKSLNNQALTATMDYLRTAIQASEESKTSKDFVARLDAAYPGYANKGVLELSAKVVTKCLGVNDMNKYQKLLHETYVLTGEGKLDAFKTYLSENVSWTEAAGFPYAGTYIGQMK